MVKKRKSLKDYFFAGLIIIIPGYISFYILMTIIKKMDSIIGLIPPKYHPETYLHFEIPGLGAIITFLLIFLIGVIFTNIVGKKLLSFIENRIFKKIPFIGPIYRGTKQIIETIFSDNKKSFKEVALIEYPKENSYALAFITGYLEKGEINKNTKSERSIAVFVPTTPNPTSGFLLILPEKKVKKIDISVETAFKIIISGGVLTEEEAINQKFEK
jgi:uncharacterized membrane protein